MTQDLIKQNQGVKQALTKLGQENSDVVVLSADLSESCGTDQFSEEFPDRYIEVGVAEQNMASIAAGMVLSGKIPFISSFGVFSPGRNWDQIRISIAYSKANVKILASHVGLSVGADGASHQALEDIALMRTLPNMTVLAPADAGELEQAIYTAVEYVGPVYIRYHRIALPQITNSNNKFKIGKSEILRDGSDIGILACGSMVAESLKAAEELEKEGIKTTILNCSSIKPLDHLTILEIAKKTRSIITCEEHQVNGGLGGAVAELLSQNYPVPMKIIGIHDTFGESGESEELFEKYKLSSKDIFEKAFEMYKRKIGK
ncbi:transketolase family protein [Patescibacteria group bacterium]